MGDETPKRDTHTVPRFYLKGFVTEPGSSHIWEYKKTGVYNPGEKWVNNPVKRSINQTTVIRDFYAYPLADGKMDYNVIENALAEMEKQADPIFEKIRSRQTISEDEKAVFAEYIVLMHRRMPRYRENIEPTYWDNLESYQLPPDVKIKELEGLTDEQKDARFKQAIINIKQDNDAPKKAHLMMLPASPDSPLVPALKAIPWYFLIAPRGRAFLTCDHPVFFTGNFEHGEAEISFPISSDICLEASWRNFNNFSEAPTKLLKLINLRTASLAANHIYFCRNEQWVVEFFKKWSSDTERM